MSYEPEIDKPGLIEELLSEKTNSSGEQTDEETEDALQKIDCEENNRHSFEGEQSCNGCGESYMNSRADDDDYDDDYE